MKTYWKIQTVGKIPAWTAWLLAVSVMGLLLAGLVARPLFTQILGGGEVLAEGQQGAAAVAAQGMKVYLDPETGELLEKPRPGAAAEAGRSVGGKPRVPLAEVPSPVLGGGVMIKLDDRFQAQFKARVGPDGKLSTECTTTDAAPAK